MADSLEKIEKLFSEEELARIESGADGVVERWRKFGTRGEALAEIDASAAKTVRLHRAKVQAEQKLREAATQRKSAVLSWRNAVRKFRRNGLAELVEDLQSMLEDEWLRKEGLEATRRNRLRAKWFVGVWLTAWFIRVMTDEVERYRVLHMFRVFMSECLEIDVTERLVCGAAEAEIGRFRSNLVEMGYDLSGTCLEHPVQVGDVSGEKSPAGTEASEGGGG